MNRVESLEYRRLLAVTATLNTNGRLLTITGDDADNSISIVFQPISPAQFKVTSGLFTVGTFPLGVISSIDVDLKGGNDQLQAGIGTHGVVDGTNSLPTRIVVRGGVGNDTIKVACTGVAEINDGAGNDLVDVHCQANAFYASSLGNDTYIGSEGADKFDMGTVPDGSDRFESHAGSGADLIDYSRRISSVRVTPFSTGGIKDDGGSNEKDDIQVTGAINGSQANDELFGTTAGETIMGLQGNDSISGGGGKDRLSGGGGRDRLRVRSSDGQVSNMSLVVSLDNFANDKLGSGSFILVNDFEEVEGGSGSDTIMGSDNPELIIGAAGNDLLDAQGGNDTINCLGFDTVFAGLGDDLVLTKTNDGILEGIGVEGGPGHDHIEGGELGNKINGGDGDDLIIGNAGKDILNGNLGNDSIQAGNGDDILHGGDGDDQLFGEDGRDQLFGENGNDTIDGGLGADTFSGGAGFDFVQNTTAGDTGDLDTGSGPQGVIINGTEGDDKISISRKVSNGNVIMVITTNSQTVQLPIKGCNTVRVNANGGNDRVVMESSAGAFWKAFFLGGDGNDTLIGSTQDDTLRGGIGDDSLIGGDGNDWLLGGPGNDVLIYT